MRAVPMHANDDSFWDDLFHGAALTAFLHVWQRTGQFPPDCESTRRLAFDLYEEALAAKNGRPIAKTSCSVTVDYAHHAALPSDVVLRRSSAR